MPRTPESDFKIFSLEILYILCYVLKQDWGEVALEHARSRPYQRDVEGRYASCMAMYAPRVNPKCKASGGRGYPGTTERARGATSCTGSITATTTTTTACTAHQTTISSLLVAMSRRITPHAAASADTADAVANSWRRWAGLY